MKNGKYWIGVFLLFVFTALGSIGFGSWFVKNEKTKGYDKYPDTTAQKVAYTQNNGTNTYYTTLYAAINNTKAGTIYVIPGTNPTLDKSVSIASGVTLSLPYLDDLKNKHVVEDEGRTSTGNFADYVEYSTKGTDKPTIFCQSNVTIADGVTLTNNGTIVVGGVLGRNGQAPTGMTVGNYSKITMGSGSVIENRGEFTCYGYVKDATGSSGGLISNYSGSTYSAKTPKGKLTLPFVIYDFRGGSYSSYSVIQAKSMPFSVFDFPNIQSKVSFSGSASLEGTITVYTNSVVTAQATVIGPSDSGALIRYSTGSNIEYKCNVPKGYTYDDYQQNTKASDVIKTTFRVSGGVQIANLSLNVGIEINTEKYNLPFSYKFDFFFEDGEVSILNKVKFLAGSNVTIGENATVSVKAETTFYRNYIPVITTGNGDRYPRYIKSARLINNGKLNLNSAFGGVVESSTEGARIFTQGGYSGSITTTEALSGRAGGILGDKEDHTEQAMFTLVDKQSYVASDDTKMRFGKGSSVLYSDKISGSTSYTSYALDHPNLYGWYDGRVLSDITYGIRYKLNSETAINNNTVTSFNKSDSAITLKKMTNTSEKYAFNGLYYDSEYTKRLPENSDGDIVLTPATAIENLNGKNHVVLYAKWIDSSEAKYTVESVTNNTDDHSSIKQNSSVPANYIVGGGFALEKPNEFYVYENLAIDKGTGTIVTYKFDGYSIQIYDGDGNLTDASIDVDKLGNSADGKFDSFAFKDVSLLKENYKVVATAKYSTESTPFSLSVTSGTDTLSKQDKTNVSITGLDVIKNIDLTFEWSANNSKATFGNTALSSTYVFNNYKGTWGATTSSAAVSVYCTIKDGTLTISKPAKEIKFKKGIAE